MKLCKNCPHKKTYEGGFMSDDQALQGELDEIHSCHLNLQKPCEGHLRDIKAVVEGRSKYTGETVKIKLPVL